MAITKESADRIVSHWQSKEIILYQIGDTVDSLMHYSRSVFLRTAADLELAYEMLSEEYEEFQRVLGLMPSQMQLDDAVQREIYKYELKRLLAGVSDGGQLLLI